MERGEREEKGQFHVFFLAVSRARAKAKEALVRRIDAAAERDWRAAAWILERQFPKEYGDVALRQPENEGGKHIPFQIIYNTGGTAEHPISMDELLDFDKHAAAAAGRTETSLPPCDHDPEDDRVE